MTFCPICRVLDPAGATCPYDYCPKNIDPKPPPELDAIARKVLGHHPKPKSKPAKARKRRAAKIVKERSRANPFLHSENCPSHDGDDCTCQ